MKGAGGKVFMAACLALAAALVAACGKKGPPLVPVKVRGEVFEYVRPGPSRGGVLVSWKEVPKLPPPPDKKGWYGYRLLRGTKGAEPEEVGTFKLTGGGGMHYEYLDLSVATGSEYKYTVQLLSGDRRVGYSSAGMTVVAGKGPPIPRGIKAVGGDGRVSVSWEPVKAAAIGGARMTGYNLFAGEKDGKPDFTRPLNAMPITGTEFLDATVTNEKTYCYRLTLAVGGPGGPEESEPSEEACATPRDTTPPSAPRGLSFNPGEGYVILSWKENVEPDLAGYRIWRRKGDEEGFLLLTPRLLVSPLYKDEDAVRGETYSYAVTAVDSSPQANESPYSNIVQVVPGR